MKIQYAHLCDYASISKEGKLSVNGIFEGIRAAQFPFRHTSLCVVFSVELRRAEIGKAAQVRIELRTEDGEMIVKAEATIQVAQQPPAPHDHVSVPQIVGLAGLAFPSPGTYQWSIFLNGHLASELSMHVGLVNPPKGAKS